MMAYRVTLHERSDIVLSDRRRMRRKGDLAHIVVNPEPPPSVHPLWLDVGIMCHPSPSKDALPHRVLTQTHQLAGHVVGVTEAKQVEHDQVRSLEEVTDLVQDPIHSI